MILIKAYFSIKYSFIDFSMIFINNSIIYDYNFSLKNMPAMLNFRKLFKTKKLFKSRLKNKITFIGFLKKILSKKF